MADHTKALVVVFLLCIPFLMASEKEHDKRRNRHTRATRTSRASDPLAAWMSRTSTSKPNILFLVVDDLRPKLGSYGDTNMVTPNLDYLVGKSVRFDQAFAQVEIQTLTDTSIGLNCAQIALCSPSRTSFLTGRRVETTRVFDLHTYFRTVAGNFTTLPQYFKQHGYLAQGVGKIFHPGAASGGNDFPYSWSAPTFTGTNPFGSFSQRKQSTIRPVNETATGKLQDTTVADFAVNFLQERSHQRDQPFFLAVGFHKPHLPWIFPQQYQNLYPRSKIQLAQHRTKPAGVPPIAWSFGNEIRSFGDIKALNITDPDGIIPDHYQYDLRQAYSAATSYVDAMVGRVLHALDQYGFSGNTVVSFLGDHGWHLGDNAEWCKHTNYDMALRIPMMLFVPGVTSRGRRFPFWDALAPDFNSSAPELHRYGSHHTSKELVEAVDLYPTLIELAGLPTPSTCPQHSLHVPFCTEGTSLVPLIRQVRNLTQGNSFTWKQEAHSVYPRKWSNKTQHLGYSVRTKTHRYTEWVEYDMTQFRPKFDRVVARELYRHGNDPFEFNNLAEGPAYSGLVSQMSQKARNGWRTTLQNYLNTVQ